QGKPVSISNPSAARNLGIGMVFQHFSLFEALSVAENIALGIAEEFDLATLSKRITQVSEGYGLPLDPSRSVHSLSVGERQRIEIVRCLLNEPQLLIMDEPTSVLTPQEVAKLFETLRRLANEGCAILYISHKLEEIRELCHKATILRLGRVVAACDPKVESARSMAQLMIGAELKTPEHGATKSTGEPFLTVQSLTIASDEAFGVDLEDISFEVRGGEILGIAGVAGNGQTELMDALTGETLAKSSSTLAMLGEEVGLKGPRARRQLGVAFVPEERLGHGAVPDMSLIENAYLSGYERMSLTRNGLIDKIGERRYAEEVVAAFDVRTAGVEHAARSLSGGNLQKFIVGRELLQSPRLIIISQPTWGVDAGAAAAIHQALINLANEGAAIVVISQDLDEIFQLSDRFLVINEGRVSESLDPRQVSLEEVGLRMGGLHAPEVPKDGEMTEDRR
ncbi:MAG: ABC transporter ATP-binding protein, partial [Kiloniellales bacterium]|nr:ABC transporter ATP-binding protein [Kiloniellales bacterium]